MASRLLLLLVALFFCSSLVGCTRCLKCIEYNALGEKAYEYKETCGDKEEIEDFQAKIEANEDPGKRVECTMRR